MHFIIVQCSTVGNIDTLSFFLKCGHLKASGISQSLLNCIFLIKMAFLSDNALHDNTPCENKEGPVGKESVSMKLTYNPREPDPLDL